jgi:hypothetical protein
MQSPVAPGRQLADRVLAHLLDRLDRTPASDEPFAHVYLEDVLPWDVYHQALGCLPAPELYDQAADRHHNYGAGAFTRSMFPLTPANLARLTSAQRDLFVAVAAALTAPELKEAVYAKLARGLAFRFGVAAADVRQLPGHARPILYRETDGFEIPPHPDTRKKVVTMHLYWPADRSQLELGTALYRRRLLALPVGPWQRRFVKVKQFAFQPNSGYAFVVTNTLTRRSWHGRERLPDGAGVRNTLMNTFYERPREGFSGYLDEPARAA